MRVMFLDEIAKVPVVLEVDFVTVCNEIIINPLTERSKCFYFDNVIEVSKVGSFAAYIILEEADDTHIVTQGFKTGLMDFTHSCVHAFYEPCDADIRRLYELSDELNKSCT